MLSKGIITALLGLAGTLPAAAAPENPAMGADWFARLKDPATRIEALYEREKSSLAEGATLADPEKFAADHHRVLVFPCRQPGQPDSWLVVNPTDPRTARELLLGSQPESYPPLPEETERRRQWDAELDPAKPEFRLWRPGQPWFEAVAGFLVSPAGKQIGENFFASPAVIADLDGDGMLDLIDVVRHHINTGGEKDSYIDCLEIGPLNGAATREVRLFCNLRTELDQVRPWRFEIRSTDDEGLRIVLVPGGGNTPEVVFRLTDGELRPASESLPGGILIDQNPKPGDWAGPHDFLLGHGMKLTGIGGDQARDIEAGRPKPPEQSSVDPRKWLLPDTAGLSPREAALAMVREQFDPAFQQQYELTSAGDPAPLPETGWLERWCDGGGWSDESTVVWWLKKDSAEQWVQKDLTTVLRETIPVDELRRRLAISHEIDLVRCIPKSPHAPVEANETGGGDDIPVYRVRALTASPSAQATVFEECDPSAWRWIGTRYDRQLAAALATHFTDPAVEGGEPLAIRDLAADWLDPAKLATTPPLLSRAAIRAIGENEWLDLEPLLTRLKNSLPAPGADEVRLAEIETAIRDYHDKRFTLRGRDEWLAERDFLALQREKLALTAKLTGNPRFELAAELAAALQNLADLKDDPSDGD